MRAKMGPNLMRRSILARSLGLAVASTGLWAQSLTIPPSLVTRGSYGSLLLTLSAPPGKAPVALQWEFTFPPNVTVELADIGAGSAAESAKKNLTCIALKGTKEAGKSSAFACILAGGQKPLPDGPIAIVRYSVPKEIREIPEKVQVGKVMGATADLKSVQIESAQAAIVVK